MLCRAIVNLQGWPEDQIRDVDEKDEAILGRLRGQYIAPVVRASVSPPPVENPAPSVSVGPTTEAGETPAEPAQRPRRKSA